MTEYETALDMAQAKATDYGVPFHVTLRTDDPTYPDKLVYAVRAQDSYTLEGDEAVVAVIAP